MTTDMNSATGGADASAKRVMSDMDNHPIDVCSHWMPTICYHRASLAHTTMPGGFCHNGKPRSNHGKPS